MRVKIITLLALAILLVASAASAMASDQAMEAQAQPIAASALPQGLFAHPVYGQQNAGDVSQVNALIKNIVDLSQDTYNSKTTGQPSIDEVKGIFTNDRLSGIPEPMGLISAMASAEAADHMFSYDPANARKALIGTNLTYTNIAGTPMNYTITGDNIKSMNIISYKGKPAWKVRVGEGMSWDLIVDGNGKILESKQLFYT